MQLGEVEGFTVTQVAIVTGHLIFVIPRQLLSVDARKSNQEPEKSEFHGSKNHLILKKRS
jgi:hypothetical protein